MIIFLIKHPKYANIFSSNMKGFIVISANAKPFNIYRKHFVSTYL